MPFDLAVFGYITARSTACLATFFIGQEAAAPDREVGGAREICALRADSAALRDQLQRTPS